MNTSKTTSSNKLSINRVLGIDPGSINFGFSVVKRQKKNAEPIKTGILEHPIKDITEKQFSEEFEAFRLDFIKLIKKYKPDLVIAERFQVRGRFMGASSEKVSLMLGVIAMLCYKYKIRFLPMISSQWKNSFNRQFPKKFANPNPKAKKQLTQLEKIYLDNKKILPAHCIDSYLIATYGMFRDELLTKPYQDVKLTQIKRLAKCYTPKVKKRKTKCTYH